VAGQQPVRAAMVAPASMDGAVCAHDISGHRRKPDRHMDRHDQQADAKRDQLLPGELVNSGRHGVYAQRVRKLQLHADQQLDVWHGLLQIQPVRRRAVHMCQRVHPDGHFHRQVRTCTRCYIKTILLRNHHRDHILYSVIT